jgi:glycosyltransferase involved in cell wall biosynthesis
MPSEPKTRTGRAAGRSSGPPVVALLPYGHVVEDYLETLGLEVDDFVTAMDGTWIFGWVDALAISGVRTAIIWPSRGVRRPERRIHEPTGTPIWLLPPSRTWRSLRRRLDNPYASRARDAAPDRGLPGRVVGAAAHTVLPWTSTSIRALQHVLREERATVLVCQEYEDARFDTCIALRRRLDVPVFGAFQGGILQRTPFERWTRPRTVPRADGLVIGATSEVERVELTYDLRENAIAHVPNPFAHAVWSVGNRTSARRELGIADDAAVVNWHGRITIAHKGLDVLLDAWELLTAGRRDRDFVLLLTGSGPDADDFRRELERRQLRGVRWLDEFVLDLAAIQTRLAASDVAVLPSRSEGFAVAPIEAMASGRGLVAATVPGLVDLAPRGEADGVVVVPQGDTAALADALSAVLADPARAELLGRAARRRSEAFSPFVVGPQLAQALGLPAVVPAVTSPALERGDRLATDGRFEASLAAYASELDAHTGDHFTRSVAHKKIVERLVEWSGTDAALAHYGLARVDHDEVLVRPGEVLCFATVRDEAERRPYFLEYYERLGVDRFFIVDNDSHDDTVDVLLKRPNVHVWSSAMDYHAANYGMAWVEVLMNSYARDHWALVVDVDEFLVYPDSEERSLHDLCHEFDRRGVAAMSAVLLDMYSDGPLREAVCEAGKDPLEVCAWFDHDFAHRHAPAATPWRNIDAYWGGVRRRVFGEHSEVFLSKVPLVRYTKDRIVPAGAHGTNAAPHAVASMRGALLHCKFTSRFVEQLDAEIRARAAWGSQAESYSTYAALIAAEPDLTMYDERRSLRFGGSRQLVEVGVMADASPAGGDEVASRPDVDEYIEQMDEAVPGWFTDTDAALFRAVDAAHRSEGVFGDLLEVGVFEGKSAILLGYLLRPDEELVAWDLFAGEPPGAEADAAVYRGLTQSIFEDHYARFHARPATAIARPSSELPRAELGTRFRIVHVDGSHRYDIVRDDIAAAIDLVTDGGVMIIDDYRTLPHALGVAAAVWEAVAEGRLVPVLASEQKLYACVRGREGSTPTALQRCASVRFPDAGLRQDIGGASVLVFTGSHLTTGHPDVAPSTPIASDGDAAALRERLALIEGSRTWRLRTKLAPLLPTRRR